MKTVISLSGSQTLLVKEKHLENSSNPDHIPAVNQGVISVPSISHTNKGKITKVLQKIITAKSKG